jgi:hypothetical protein
MLRAILGIILGFSFVSRSIAEVTMSVPDGRIIEWNFDGLSAPTIVGPMCAAKPRPLPCGMDCWRAIPNENFGGALDQKEFSQLLAAFKEDLARLDDTDTSGSDESTKRTEEIFRKILDRLEAQNKN